MIENYFFNRRMMDEVKVEIHSVPIIMQPQNRTIIVVMGLYNNE